MLCWLSEHLNLAAPAEQKARLDVMTPRHRRHVDADTRCLSDDRALPLGAEDTAANDGLVPARIVFRHAHGTVPRYQSEDTITIQAT